MIGAVITGFIAGVVVLIALGAYMRRSTGAEQHGEDRVTPAAHAIGGLTLHAIGGVT